MKISSPRSKRRARLEIVPLIDIIFFLLATFMIVSLSMVRNKGLPVNLPRAGTAITQLQNDYDSISVSEKGVIYFDKKKITISELPALLRHLKATKKEPKLFINGDAHSQLGVTIAIFDVARKAGITKVSFNTKNTKATPNQREP